jgi:hypothetical protein
MILGGSDEDENYYRWAIFFKEYKAFYEMQSMN